jgi:hypothetical protein
MHATGETRIKSFPITLFERGAWLSIFPLPTESFWKSEPNPIRNLPQKPDDILKLLAEIKRVEGYFALCGGLTFMASERQGD